jgi:hypothetical protein
MAETITSEVVGKVVLPAGAPPSGAAPPKRYQGVASKPFHEVDPQIQVRPRRRQASSRAALSGLAFGRARR